MKKILVTILALTLVFVGCNKQTKEEEKNFDDHKVISLSDDYKVISLSPSITENIIGIGMEDTLVAVDTYSFFEETEDLVQIDAMALNVEEILLLEPTHILVSDYNYAGDKKSDYKVFEDAKIKVIAISGASSIDDIYKGILEVGKALDNTEASEKLIDETKKKVEDIVNKYSDYEPKSVYMEIAPAPNIYTPGKTSFTNEMIEMVGGKNIFGDINEDYFSPSAENIVELNPEIIITNVSYIDDPVGEIMTRSGFSEINAVKNNNVYQVATDSTSRPSYRFVDGLEAIAAAIHNEK